MKTEDEKWLDDKLVAVIIERNEARDRVRYLEAKLKEVLDERETNP
jgi:hypothetical protein